MYLMNGDKKVLWFDNDYTTIKVLDNDFLPYSLKDYVKDSYSLSFKQAVFNIDILKDFFLNRILLMNRENTKAILLSAGMPQSNKSADKLKIVEACRALSMGDNFWIQRDDENLSFSDVNLRKATISDIVFDITILGKISSVSTDILTSALTTKGMFPKTFINENDEIYLIKTDTLTGTPLTKAELQVSDILDTSNVNHIQYFEEQRKNILFAKCKCYADNNYSVVDATIIKEWCAHTSRDFLTFVWDNFKEDFAKMCVIDYVLANTDRHMDNWGFKVDNATNTIIGIAPLFDHNQALIADAFETNIDTLMYQPTNMTMFETAKKYFSMANLKIDEKVV